MTIDELGEGGNPDGERMGEVEGRLGSDLGLEPILGSLCQACTCVGNMSCRAFRSFPSPLPVIPTSSP